MNQLWVGMFPKLLKHARVFQIIRSDEPEQANKYRPISTLPVISKLFEELLFWITEFLIRL